MWPRKNPFVEKGLVTDPRYKEGQEALNRSLTRMMDQYMAIERANRATALKDTALWHGFDKVEEYQAHVAHWQSPWGKVKKLFGCRPKARESLLPPVVWRPNSVRVPKGFISIEPDA